MDFMTPSCPICCLYISDVLGHYRWHLVTDRQVTQDQPSLFAEAQQQFAKYAEQWAEMDRRAAERKARRTNAVDEDTSRPQT